MQIEVETYSGYKADERPVRFRIGGRILEVTDIADRWHGPDHTYFKVLADDGNVYVLRQALQGPETEWTLSAYRPGSRP